MVIAESCDSQSAGDRQKFGELIRQKHVTGGGFLGEFSKKIEKSLRHFAEHFLLSQAIWWQITRKKKKDGLSPSVLTKHKIGTPYHAYFTTENYSV